MQYPKANDVKWALNDALRVFYLNDLYLIEHDVHERALTFRLGFYLQQIFYGWDVDCGSSKNPVTPLKNKLLRSKCSPKVSFDCGSCDHSPDCTIFPAIIIHKRGLGHNLLLIEAKKDASESDMANDIARIKAGLKEDALRYRYGLFLDFKSTKKETVESSVFFDKNRQSDLKLDDVPITKK